MNLKFFADSVLIDGLWLDDQVLAVHNGSISAIGNGKVEDADIHLQGRTCAGFIDTQVNGGGGRLFNQEPTLHTVQTMIKAHAKYGTNAMLPTVITSDYETMHNCALAISEAIANKQDGIIGIHFEGPHLSDAKRGIHPANQIRQLSEKEMALFCRRDLGQVLVTVAPETVTTEQIKTLVEQNVIVSLGHTNASYKSVMEALNAGASGFTHLYNAMSTLSAREPGVIGAALSDDASFAGLIVDHFHVHNATCKLAMKCKGIDRIMLVTDSMSHVDAENTVLLFNGEEIIKQNGKLSTPDGTLAGSALDMMSAVTNCHIGLDCALRDAIKMASETPARFLKKHATTGKIAVGYEANFICFNERFEVKHNYYRGRSLLD